MCIRDRNIGEALKWVEKAARQGLAIAQYTLGTFYQDGVGVSTDEDRALYWLRKAIGSYENATDYPEDLHQRYQKLQ